MGKQNAIFLTEEELNAVLNACRAAVDLSKIPENYFEQFGPHLKTAFDKLYEKWDEINDANRK